MGVQKNHGKNETSEVAAQHFRTVNAVYPVFLISFQLTRTHVESLYQQYLVDFDMFDYSPKVYLELAN